MRDSLILIACVLAVLGCHPVDEVDPAVPANGSDASPSANESSSAEEQEQTPGQESNNGTLPDENEEGSGEGSTPAEIAEPSLPDVTLNLYTGYMGASGVFASTENTLYTCEQSEGSNPQFLIQVGATLTGDEGLDPWFTKFQFTSDTKEWVGYNGNTVYQTQEACEQTGQACDDVVIGGGESGYPDQGAGHMGIQNVYCRYWGGETYTITLSVQALTQEVPPGTSGLLAEESIEVNCEPRPCCPSATYLETHGNHTTVPWECDD